MAQGAKVKKRLVVTLDGKSWKWLRGEKERTGVSLAEAIRRLIRGASKEWVK